MKRKTNTLIVGATYFGIGYASAHGDCLILESSQIAGCDFHHGTLTADISSIGQKESSSDLGKLMKAYHAWDNDKFDVLKAAPVLHKYLTIRDDINMILDAKILAVTKTDCGYSVKYITNSGINEICCAQILDTTVLRDTYPEGAYCTAKTLDIFTLCLTDTFADKLKAVCPECTITDGMYPDERIITIPFSGEDSLLNAYRKVTDLWRKAFPDSEEKILFIAQDFHYCCEPANEASAPCKWISEKFPNPLTAFVKGMEYQL